MAMIAYRAQAMHCAGHLCGPVLAKRKLDVCQNLTVARAVRPNLTRTSPERVHYPGAALGSGIYSTDSLWNIGYSLAFLEVFFLLFRIDKFYGDNKHCFNTVIEALIVVRRASATVGIEPLCLQSVAKRQVPYHNKHPSVAQERPLWASSKHSFKRSY